MQQNRQTNAKAIASLFVSSNRWHFFQVPCFMGRLKGLQQLLDTNRAS